MLDHTGSLEKSTNLGHIVHSLGSILCPPLQQENVDLPPLKVVCILEMKVTCHGLSYGGWYFSMFEVGSPKDGCRNTWLHRELSQRSSVCTRHPPLLFLAPLVTLNPIPALSSMGHDHPSVIRTFDITLGCCEWRVYDDKCIGRFIMKPEWGRFCSCAFE